MALSARLELKQSQSLVMTPQLMQAIKLLQLSNFDLVAYVEAELERNPLLERQDERDGEPVAGEDIGGAPAHEPAVPTGESGEWFSEAGAPTTTAVTEVFDTEISNVFPDDAGEPRQDIMPGLDAGQLVGDEWSHVSAPRSLADGDDYSLESYVASEISLRDHLTAQMLVQISDPTQRLIGYDLIDSVDDAGYLRTDLAQTAERLGCDLALVESVLAILQGFDPVGACARDLAECLTLQLKDRNRYDPAMKAMLDNIELLARRDIAALRRACNVDDDDIGEMISEIVALNPKPGNAFGRTVVQPVVPDVVVRSGPDGGWAIELNSETLPRVLVNQVYYATVSRTTRDETEKSYLTDCFQTANWLVKSLDQRAKTILKVSTEIVRQQDAFLARGVEHLRPLNLKMIADAIGMHESTVSRVTSNKYMATPRGIFELKYFFTSSIASSDGGDAHSAESVRHRIKQMIDQESTDDILSDDTIVQQLRDAGVDIARRTVAKYREAMRIPSSVQRRRLKQTATGA